MPASKNKNDASSIGVRVKPDTTNFAEDLKAALKKIQDTTELTIRVHLDTRGLSDQAKAAAAAAKAEAEAATAAVPAEPLSHDSTKKTKLDVEADTTKAELKLKEFFATAKKRFDVVVNVTTGTFDAGKFIAGKTAIVGIAAAATSAAGNAVSLAGSLAQVAGVAALLPAAAGSLAAVGATLATAFHGVGTALSAVSDAAKPKAPTTDPRLDAMAHENAVQGVATAETNARDSITKADRDVADSKRALQDTIQQVADAHQKAVHEDQQAEQSLAMAQRDAQDAQKALNKAREDAVINLRDLDQQLKSASLSEQDAAVKYRNASDAYHQALTDPSKSATAIAALKLEMDKAENSLVDQKYKVDDLSKAKAKAVSQEKTGTDAVQLAARNLADAQTKITEAQYNKAQADAAVTKQQIDGSRQIELAQRNVSDATYAAQKAQVDGARSIQQAQQALLQVEIQQADAAGKAQKDANAAMANLAPSAQEAVTALSSVKGQLGEIRKTVQENFFSGFAAPLKEAAAVILPQLKTGLGSVATALGGGVQTLMTSLKTSLSGGVLDGMLQNMAKGMSAANGAIAPITGALARLGTVGAIFLPQLGTGFADISTKFGDFIAKVTADGSLKTWIQTGLDTVKSLGSALGSAGSIVGSIFQAAKAAGGTTVDGLANGLKQVAAIVGKEPFQTALRTIFEGANSAMSGLMTGLKPLGDMLVSMAPTIAKVFDVVGKIGGTALTGLSKALSDPTLQKGLTDVFQGILVAVQALSPALAPLAQVFGVVLSVIGQIITVAGPILADLLMQLAPIALDLAKALSPLITALGPLLSAAIKLALPLLVVIVDLAKLLVPIITGLAEVLTGILSGNWDLVWKGLRDVLDGMLMFLVKLIFVEIPKLLGSLLGIFGGLGGGIMRALSWVGRWLGSMWDEGLKGAGNFLSGIGRFFADLPKNLGNIFAGLGKWLGDAGGRLMGFFGDGIKNAAKGVGDKIGEVMNWVKGFFPHSPAKHGPLSGSGWDEIGSAGTAIAASFAGGISGSTPLVGAASDTLMRAVTMPKPGVYNPATAGTGAALAGGPSIVNNIHEAVSARATAIEVNRLQSAGV